MSDVVQELTRPTPGVWTQVAPAQQVRAQLDWLAQAEVAAQPFALAVKDSIGVRGLVRSAGCPVLATAAQEQDAPVVSALRDLGAVVVGMTNMDELALGITSQNAHYGTVLLPGFGGYCAGGSSGGSAAAVAEGSVRMALGADTGGSISIPASHCGVYGYRPSTGRWPTAGMVGLSWTRDTPGVHARSVADLQVADQAVSCEATPRGDAEHARRRLRVGVPEEFCADLDPRTGEAVTRALDAVRDHADIERVSLARIQQFARQAELPTVWWEARRVLGAAAAEALQVSPAEGVARLAAGAGSADVAGNLARRLSSPHTPQEYAEAVRLNSRARTAYAHLMESRGLDVLLFPTTPAPALPRDVGLIAAHNGRDVSIFELQTRHLSAGTGMGLPMVTIPLPVGPGQLPVGLSVQGVRHADRACLAAAAQIDQWVR